MYRWEEVKTMIHFIVNGAIKSESKYGDLKTLNASKELIKKSTLPVECFNQGKAWIAGDMLDTILSKINIKPRKNGRSVPTMLDVRSIAT